MKMDRELDGILGEIRREHRAIPAPESVEAALCAAVKERQSATRVRGLRPAWVWGFALAALAAIVLSGAVWEMRGSHGQQDRQVAAVHTTNAPTTSDSAPSVRRESPPSRQTKAARDSQTASASLDKAGAVRAHFHTASPRRKPANSLEEFVPLPVSEGLPPAAQLSVVRVKLLGSDLQQYGLQAPADGAVRMLSAEFVVGEDGLPRAIRIVR
jgi:hypothetical protein